LTECLDEILECVVGSLFAGSYDCGQNTLPPRAEPGAVAAPDFAVDDRRTNRLFAAIVRGVDRSSLLKMSQKWYLLASFFPRKT
jgi:hypothetical protein